MSESIRQMKISEDLIRNILKKLHRCLKLSDIHYTSGGCNNVTTSKSSTRRDSITNYKYRHDNSEKYHIDSIKINLKRIINMLSMMTTNVSLKWSDDIFY